jgi:hypothetical protein
VDTVPDRVVSFTLRYFRSRPFRMPLGMPRRGVFPVPLKKGYLIIIIINFF